MIKNHRVIDVIDHYAVMVNHHNLLAAFVYFRTFDQIDRMRVGNNKKRFIHNQINRCFRQTDHILLFVFDQPAHKHIRKISSGVQYDIRLLAKTAACLCEANCRTKRIKIRKAMPHHKHVIAALNELRQCGSHDAGFNLGLLFHTL